MGELQDHIVIWAGNAMFSLCVIVTAIDDGPFRKIVTRLSQSTSGDRVTAAK
jgi:hypothetical protein